MHPDTGALVAVDTPLRYAAGDPAWNQRPRVTASGYTNSVANATSTALYGIDSRTDTLVLQGSVLGATPIISPNTGQLFTVGKLGLNITDLNGFDIAGAARSTRYDPDDFHAIAAVRTGGLLGLSLLVDINLKTGRASIVSVLLANPIGLTFAG